MAQSRGGRSQGSKSKSSRSGRSRRSGSTSGRSSVATRAGARRGGSRSKSSSGGSRTASSRTKPAKPAKPSRTRSTRTKSTRTKSSRSKSSRSTYSRGTATRNRRSATGYGATGSMDNDVDTSSEEGGAAGFQAESSATESEPARGRDQDALSLLAKDHRNVEKLFKRVQKDPAVFDQIREELDLHTRVEEDIFYPAVEEALGEEGEGIVEEARREHQEVKDLLAELAALDRQGEEFEDRLQKLQDNVEHYVQEEEGEMFKKTRRALSKDHLAELGAQMASQKEDMRAVLAQS
jgi:hemerythrin superfamily protein